MHLSNSGTARHAGGPLKSCSSTILHVAAISRPDGVMVNGGQPSCSRSTSVSVATCGSENSQVPPPRKAWPSRHSISSNDFGRFTSAIVFKFISSLPISVSCGQQQGYRRPRCAWRDGLGWSLLQVVERGGARTWRDQRRPLVGAERHGGRQEGLLAALLHFRND